MLYWHRERLTTEFGTHLVAILMLDDSWKMGRSQPLASVQQAGEHDHTVLIWA